MEQEDRVKLHLSVCLNASTGLFCFDYISVSKPTTVEHKHNKRQAPVYSLLSKERLFQAFQRDAWAGLLVYTGWNDTNP